VKTAVFCKIYSCLRCNTNTSLKRRSPEEVMHSSWCNYRMPICIG